jgi:hypothetical protein
VTVPLTPSEDHQFDYVPVLREGKMVIDDVVAGGVADGKLQVGDILLSVDGVDVRPELASLPKPSGKARPYTFVVHRAKNGGKRTDVEQMKFGHQLKHANLLYLGCDVLVLLDLSYQGRFWCAQAVRRGGGPSAPHTPPTLRWPCAPPQRHCVRDVRLCSVARPA